MPTPSRASRPSVAYRIRIVRPERHEIEVEAVFPPSRRTADAVLKLPVWSPGSYLVREYARHLSALDARDLAGRRLPVEKVAKNAWRVEGGGRSGLRVRYRLYAFERSVRTSHVSSDHAFLSGPAVFLFQDELRAARCTVEVEAPRGWKVACALPARGGRLEAPDYDTLVDSPIECGRLRALDFTVAGTPFHVVFCGEGNEDRKRLRRDLPRIASTARELFGSFPFARYLAIVNLTPASRGGLEHLSSMALEWPALRFRPDERYEDFLALFSHELFHAWNVKSATPAAFRPYDYDRESPTRLLWWFEGVTDYYDELLLRRAGLLTPRKYLDRVVERWDHLLDTPGRLRTSVAGASFDSWIKFYRPDENSPNATVSYYEKGHLVGLALDLEVRRVTRNRKSLDDVLRLVVKRGRAGLPEDGVLRAVEDVTGRSFARWFARYVDGTEELPLLSLLAGAGLALGPREKDASKPRGALLGAPLRSSGGRVHLASVLDGGPAAAAGLSANDEVIAWDGHRVDESALKERLEQASPKDRVRISFFREERLRDVTVTLGIPPVRRRAYLAARATGTQRALLESWMGKGALELETAPEEAVQPRPARRAARRRRASTERAEG